MNKAKGKKEIDKHSIVDRIWKILLSRLYEEADLLIKKEVILLEVGITFLKRDNFMARLDGAKIINSECDKISLLDSGH